MVANWEPNLVHLLDNMIHHGRTAKDKNQMKLMEGRWGEKRKVEDTFKKMCLLFLSAPFSVFGQVQKAIIPHFVVNILTFSYFLNQDENFFISQTAANMFVNATDFKFPSKSTFCNTHKNVNIATVSIAETSLHNTVTFPL
jgi:hypothetical protein